MNCSKFLHLNVIIDSYNDQKKGGFTIKKIVTLVLAISILTASSSLAFARDRSYKTRYQGGRSVSITLKKSIKAIAPRSTTSSAIDPQIVTMAGNVKSANESNITITKQIITKKFDAFKLIAGIRRSGQTVSDSQYTSLSNQISTINNEAAAIININGLNNAISIANGKNTSKLGQVTLQNLTTMLSSINTNTQHLNTIAAAYDSINSILSGIESTTSSAITTQPAISN